MAQHYTTARPYAKAVFEAAEASNSADAWAQVLQSMTLVASNATVLQLLINPKVTFTELLDMFKSAANKYAQAAVTQLDKKLDNLLKLLHQQKRLAIMPDITELFLRMMAESRGIIKVDVFSAQELDDAQKAQMAAALAQRFNSEIELNYAINEELIGGALVRAGNWVLDGSVRGRLTRMGDSLL